MMKKKTEWTKDDECYIFSLRQLVGSIGPTLGTNYIVDTFMVVVLGVSEELSHSGRSSSDRNRKYDFRIFYQRLFGKGTCISCGYSLSSMEASGVL